MSDRLLKNITGHVMTDDGGTITGHVMTDDGGTITGYIVTGDGVIVYLDMWFAFGGNNREATNLWIFRYDS